MAKLKNSGMESGNGRENRGALTRKSRKTKEREVL